MKIQQKKENLQNYNTTKVEMYTNIKKDEKKNQTKKLKFQSTRLQN